MLYVFTAKTQGFDETLYNHKLGDGREPGPLHEQPGTRSGPAVGATPNLQVKATSCFWLRHVSRLVL